MSQNNASRVTHTVTHTHTRPKKCFSPGDDARLLWFNKFKEIFKNTQNTSAISRKYHATYFANFTQIPEISKQYFGY